MGAAGAAWPASMTCLLTCKEARCEGARVGMRIAQKVPVTVLAPLLLWS